MNSFFLSTKNLIKLPSYSFVLILLLILIPGCDYLSLADDIVPPPGSELPAVMPTQALQSGPLYPLVPPNPLAGEPIYLESCAPCHGASGRGDGSQAANLPILVKSLTSPEVYRQSTPAEWYSLITEGNLERFMPPFLSLSARQRWDVVAYVYTLGLTPETTLLGMDLYQNHCADCHGESGDGDGRLAADLTVLPTDFTDQAYMASRSAQDFFTAISVGVGEEMPSFSDQLSEADRWTLATSLRAFSFVVAGVSADPLEEEVQITPHAVEEIEQLEEIELEDESDTKGGIVTGMIINASGGEIPSGSEVTLHGFDNMQETFTERATVMQDGTFIFEGIEMRTGRAYIASIEYQQTPYGSDVFVVEESTEKLDLTIHVFEAISDASILKVDRLHIFFEYQEPNVLSVTELYILSNPSIFTVAPTEAGEPVVTFNLPDSAFNLRLDDGFLGERFVETASGFGDTAVVRPGMGAHQVLYAYDLPYDRRIDLVFPISLPVDAVVLLVREDGLKVESDQLFESGRRDVQGENFTMYSSSRLEAGSELVINISGKPTTQGAFLPGGSGTSLIIGLGALGLALIAAGIWLFRRNQLEEVYEDDDSIEDEFLGESSYGEEIPDDVDTLMDTIIALDDLYKEGGLPEDVYHRRRAVLKDRLRDLLDEE
jgi:mono/diheme cytochrome c family protein